MTTPTTSGQRVARKLGRFVTYHPAGDAMTEKPVAYLVEFEDGSRELHFAEHGVPACGETVTPLYAVLAPRVAP
jgi:hypothetical protein